MKENANDLFPGDLYAMYGLHYLFVLVSRDERSAFVLTPKGRVIEHNWEDLDFTFMAKHAWKTDE